MGNWMHGLVEWEIAYNCDATRAERDAFQAGVDWGRRDLLYQAVTLMRDEHDRVYTGGETCQLSGYELADKLNADWGMYNVKKEV